MGSFLDWKLVTLFRVPCQEEKEPIQLVPIFGLPLRLADWAHLENWSWQSPMLSEVFKRAVENGFVWSNTITWVGHPEVFSRPAVSFFTLLRLEEDLEEHGYQIFALPILALHCHLANAFQSPVKEAVLVTAKLRLARMAGECRLRPAAAALREEVANELQGIPETFDSFKEASPAVKLLLVMVVLKMLKHVNTVALYGCVYRFVLHCFCSVTSILFIIAYRIITVIVMICQTYQKIRKSSSSVCCDSCQYMRTLLNVDRFEYIDILHLSVELISLLNWQRYCFCSYRDEFRCWGPDGAKVQVLLLHGLFGKSKLQHQRCIINAYPATSLATNNKDLFPNSGSKTSPNLVPLMCFCRIHIMWP